MGEIQAALERLISNRASQEDIRLLQQAEEDGRLSIAGAERSVAAGGNIVSSVVITGDHNVVTLPIEALALLKPGAYPELEAQEAGQFAGAIQKSLSDLRALIKKPPKTSENPYQDFSPFDKTDGWRFYGRNAQIDDLTDKLTSSSPENKIIMLRSPEGAGKTSLLQAGLIPSLSRKGHLPLLVQVNETALIPTLRRALLPDIDSWQTIKDKPLCKLLELAAQGLEGKNIVVMLDSFEEFLNQPKEDQGAFIQELTTCLKDTQSTDKWLISIDSSAESQLYTLFPELINHVDHYLLPLLGREEALEAITQPADLCGIELEDCLAERILDDLGRDAYVPFDMEIILHTLAGGHGTRKSALTLQDLEDIGGASQFSSRYLDFTLKDDIYFTPDERNRYAWELLATLARQPGLTASRELLQNEMKPLALGGDSLQALLKKLEVKRLAMPVEGGYKLANIRLLPRIQEWTREQQAVKRKASQETARQLKLVRTSALRGLFGGALGFGLAVAITWWVKAKDILPYILTILLSTGFGGVAGTTFTLVLDLANRSFTSLPKRWLRWLISGMAGGLVYAVLLLAFYLLRGDPNPLNWATVLIEGTVWGFAIGACTAWAMDNTIRLWLALLGISICGGLLLMLIDATFGMAFSHRMSATNPREAADAWSLLVGGMLMAFLLASAALLGRQAVNVNSID